jgi:phosphoribosylglycinamide formyltransferase-1
MAIKRAAALGIPSVVVNHREFGNRREFEQAVTAELDRHEAELVCLAGFMRILSPWFTDRWAGRVMNIHPSLLPAFAGLHGMQVHRAVMESGVRITGCTVHFVDDKLDGGPIIVQRAISVGDDDTPESLSMRVLAEEHLAYPEAVRLFAENRLEITGRRVRRRN